MATLRKRGVRTAVLCSEPFLKLAQAQAKTFGVPDLPIIMITSRIAEKHREHAMELGVNHYLGKPYSDEELLSLIQHYARIGAAAGV